MQRFDKQALASIFILALILTAISGAIRFAVIPYVQNGELPTVVWGFDAPAPVVVQVEPAPPAPPAPEPVVVAPAAPMPEPVAPAPTPEPPVYVVQPVIVEPTPPAVILTEPCRPSGKPTYRNPYSSR